MGCTATASRSERTELRPGIFPGLLPVYQQVESRFEAIVEIVVEHSVQCRVDAWVLHCGKVRELRLPVREIERATCSRIQSLFLHRETQHVIDEAEGSVG